MLAEVQTTETDRFARCIEISKRVRWDIERDVIKGRRFDITQKFLPDGLSLVEELEFLSEAERLFLSQIQGRTYANIFGLVERFINAKVLEVSRDYWLGDQVALEALIRFSDEELKHQELFRRVERLAGADMPAGYAFAPDPDEVARIVLSKSTWSVLALTLDIELFTQLHYRESIESADNLSDLWKDVFLFHWKEECQHAVVDELELIRCDEQLTEVERDGAVSDLIDLVVAVDGILQMQAKVDADYFAGNCGRKLSDEEMAASHAGILKAYRWQYILSGVQHPHFAEVLFSLLNKEQAARIEAALATLM
ncbi:hypothetical protein [uncultured Boseongicola sp.]|uniref:hypothetical protein n=1 Tax=uncultured Boseongicola sp. TaxID=1648499 RepID=UPI002631DF98|nr:hypothetical protein [uncultured Boseongicola sp.]